MAYKHITIVESLGGIYGVFKHDWYKMVDPFREGPLKDKTPEAADLYCHTHGIDKAFYVRGNYTLYVPQKEVLNVLSTSKPDGQVERATGAEIVAPSGAKPILDNVPDLLPEYAKPKPKATDKPEKSWI